MNCDNNAKNQARSLIDRLNQVVFDSIKRPDYDQVKEDEKLYDCEKYASEPNICIPQKHNHTSHQESFEEKHEHVEFACVCIFESVIDLCQVSCFNNSFVSILEIVNRNDEEHKC